MRDNRVERNNSRLNNESSGSLLDMKESQYLPSVTKDKPINPKARLYKIHTPQDPYIHNQGSYQSNAYYSASNFQKKNFGQNNNEKQKNDYNRGSESSLDK